MSKQLPLIYRDGGSIGPQGSINITDERFRHFRQCLSGPESDILHSVAVHGAGSFPEAEPQAEYIVEKNNGAP